MPIDIYEPATRNHYLLQIRFSKKEAKITTALITTQRLEPREDIGFAPIGLDEPYRVIISEDPILKPGNPDIPFMVPALLKKPAMLHAYIYVENNPINKKDPLGLMSCGGCDLNTCLNACAASRQAIRNFCAGLPLGPARAACWCLELMSETACRGWCFWNCK